MKAAAPRSTLQVEKMDVLHGRELSPVRPSFFPFFIFLRADADGSEVNDV